MVEDIDIDDDENDDDDDLGEVRNEIQRAEGAPVAYSPIFDPEAAAELESNEEPVSFDETDFDDKFDDDFEEEIEGEYELEDDHYGEEFAEVEEAMGMKKPPKAPDKKGPKKK